MLAGLSDADDFPGDPDLAGQSTAVRCIVNWFGPTDMTHEKGIPLRSREREIEVFGVAYEEDKDLF